MSDEPALLAAIRASPLERTPRLLYADWLDEHDRPRDGALQRVLAEPERDDHRLNYAAVCERDGDAARAEFVRAQVELAAVMANIASDLTRPVSPMLERMTYLRSREAELWDEGNWLGWKSKDWFDTINSYLRPQQYTTIGIRHWLRGFVESLTCTAADWLAGADAILAAHPVLKVRLTTWPGYQFNPNGMAQLAGRKSDHWVPRGESHDHSQKGIATALCQMEWPGVTFELPPHHESRLLQIESTDAFNRFRREQEGAIARALGIPSHIINSIN